MELILIAIKIIHIIVSILLIIVVLLQPGKSGDLGSIFGGGTSESIFGSSGAVPFLVKVTRGLAILFMMTSLTLGYLAASTGGKSVVTDVPEAAVNEPAPGSKAPEGAVAPQEKAASPEAPAGKESAPKPADAGNKGQKADDTGQKKAQ
ncbi:MAG TPA: preprotein translocase subunit SecG [Thermodesulfobacteriota bacterium]|nr:preprotein translocase subunit SecG [Thermodesulfobacteriota bacterium]